MPSIYDIYQFYIEPDEVKDSPRPLIISQATLDKVFKPGENKREPIVILHFYGEKKVLTCNKTRAADMEKITGTDDYTKWMGTRVVLTAGKTSGKDTVVISGDHTNQPPSVQSTSPIPTMTIRDARQLKVKKNGGEVFLGELFPKDLLTVIEHAKDPRFVEAARMVLQLDHHQDPLDVLTETQPEDSLSGYRQPKTHIVEAFQDMENQEEQP